MFFENMIVAFIIIGILTRLSNFFLYRKQKKSIRPYLSFLTIGLLVIPIVIFTLGYDIAIFEYGIPLLIWLLIDILHATTK